MRTIGLSKNKAILCGFSAWVTVARIFSGCASLTDSSVEKVQVHQYRVHEGSESELGAHNANHLTSSSVCAREGNRVPQVNGTLKGASGSYQDGEVRPHYIEETDILCVEPGQKPDFKPKPVFKIDKDKFPFSLEKLLLLPLAMIPPSGITHCLESNNGGKAELENLSLKYTAKFRLRNLKYKMESLQVSGASEKARQCADSTRDEFNKEGLPFSKPEQAEFAADPDHEVLFSSGEVFPLQVNELHSESGKFKLDYRKAKFR